MIAQLKNSLFLFVLLSSLFSFSQEKKCIKEGVLPEELKEASGLELLNDSTFIAINDGGNKAELFLLNLDGSLQRKVTVLNEKNHDWEDLTSDGCFLYIADFGNNNNKRKNLRVLKVKLNDITTKKEVVAEKIYFNYNEQVSFPPKKEEMNFDAEAIVCIGDSLLILTKINTVPWTGGSQLYYLSKSPGIYSIKKSGDLFVGSNGWYIDAITGADYLNGELIITTYNRLLMFNFAKNNIKLTKEILFSELTQKEGVLLKSADEVFIVDEKSRFLGGGNLFKIK
ncbi:MAG TPA: hypothetical protein EYG86_09815 [Crocinitomicaceae bacterium]|nr:hypothetical protein [Crocinitomicaceae bacterium]